MSGQIIIAVTFRGHLSVILPLSPKGGRAMKRILIVEDDALLNKTLAYNLISDGWDVTPSLNARTAENLLVGRLSTPI